MININEGGDELKLTEEIQKQTAQKQAIVSELREKEAKVAAENAVMVEKIKKQMAETRAEQKKNNTSLSLNSVVAMVIAVVFIVLFRRWRRKRAAGLRPYRAIGPEGGKR